MSLHWENDILVGSSEDCTWEADPPKGDFTNFEQKDPALSDNGFSSTPSLSNHTGSSSYYNKLDEPFNVNAGHTVTVGGDGHSAIAIGYDCDPGTVFKLTKIDWSGNILSESLNYRVTSGYPGYGDVIWKIEVLCGRVIVDNVTGWRPPPVEIADCEQIPYPLQISHSSAQIPVGQTFLLSAQDMFDEITTDEVSLSWTSNNSSVAKVEDGLVTALQPGKAIVSVEACNGLYKRSCTVTVY